MHVRQLKQHRPLLLLSHPISSVAQHGRPIYPIRPDCETGPQITARYSTGKPGFSRTNCVINFAKLRHPGLSVIPPRLALPRLASPLPAGSPSHLIDYHRRKKADHHGAAAVGKKGRKEEKRKRISSLFLAQSEENAQQHAKQLSFPGSTPFSPSSSQRDLGLTPPPRLSSSRFSALVQASSSLLRSC